MSVETILERYAGEQGWDDSSIIYILLEYIENQQNDDAFEEHLIRAQEEDLWDEYDDEQA